MEINDERLFALSHRCEFEKLNNLCSQNAFTRSFIPPFEDNWLTVYHQVMVASTSCTLNGSTRCVPFLNSFKHCRDGAHAVHVPFFSVESSGTVFLNSMIDDTKHCNCAIVCNITRATQTSPPTALPLDSTYSTSKQTNRQLVNMAFYLVPPNLATINRREKKVKLSCLRRC